MWFTRSASRPQMSIMSNLALAFAATALGVLGAASAGAKELNFSSSIGVKFGFGPVTILTGCGVATINGSGTGSHLDQVHIEPTGSANGMPIPVTDPEVTGTLASYIVDGVSVGVGTLAPPSAVTGNGTLNLLALAGVARVCMISSGCASSLPLNLSRGSGAAGIGVGGIVTAGYLGPVRISLVNAPWQ